MPIGCERRAGGLLDARRTTSMSLRSRALRLHPVLLGALLASGCAGIPIPESLRPDVGHVAGRVEHGERGVSVIHM